MDKKKIISIIGVVILAIIVILVAITFRKYIIITKLQTKVSQYSESSNFYTKSTTLTDDGTKVVIEYYKKDQKQMVKILKEENKEITTTLMYDNGESVDTFIESPNEKIAKLNRKTNISVNIYNHLENENKWQTLLGCFSAKVKTNIYNDKECYIIRDFISSTSLTAKDTEIYIEKDTGLLLKTVNATDNTEKEYQFNNVTDDIFIEPEINQYEIQ